EFVALRRAGWLVSPMLEGRLRGAGGPPVALTGLDLLSAPPGALPPGMTAVGGDTDPADLFTAPGTLFAAPALAERLAEVQGLPPVQAVAGLAADQAVTDIGTAQRLLGRGGEISHLLVLPAQPLGRPPLAEIAPGLTRVAAESAGDIAQLTRSFHLNLTAFGLLSFGVGLFISHGAIGLAFEQRRPTIRTLRALGVPQGRLFALLIAETALMALVAGALGLALGYALAGLLLPDVAATLRGLYGAPVAGELTLRPAWAAAGLAMALTGAALASVQTFTRLSAMPLLASARPRAWATVSTRALNRQALAGALLLALGLAAPSLADGLIAGFALLAGLLLGAALVLPRVLAALLALGARGARTPLAQWFWADARQQLPGLSLALMALLLALAANIGVSTMVNSFRLTFVGWLDQRLAADLYVDTANEAETEALTAWAATAGIDLLPRASVETRLDGRPGSLEGLIVHPLYRATWPLLTSVPGAWEALAAGDAVLVNEQLAYGGSLGLGDPVALGEDWVLPIAGIYADYGNPRPQAFVALNTLTARFPGTPVRDVGLIAPEGETGAELAARLVAETPLDRAAMIDQSAVKALSLRVFERTFAVTAALNVLTLSVAAVAILTALLTLAGLRLPQLAPVWAIGVPRARLARLDLLRALMLAALTFAVAVPLGIVTAWALLDVVNVEAFGWRLPMYLFPWDWVLLLALSLVAAGLAGLWPARRLARTAPSTFLKVFADER
ncbi:MAG: FtsX-like permease family protein, partial [Pseudomonadota bacterium]